MGAEGGSAAERNRDIGISLLALGHEPGCIHGLTGYEPALELSRGLAAASAANSLRYSPAP